MKTVSNVLHGAPHVSPQMHDRVKRAMEELGYRPHLFARKLATGRSGMLALAVSDISIPYFAELTREVSARAWQRGYRLVLEQFDERDGERNPVVSAAEAGLVDGVLLQPHRRLHSPSATVPTEVPVVLLGEDEAPLGMDHVMIDNQAGARTATRHLARLGRHRIAFLGIEKDFPTTTSLLRLRGYQEGLALESLSQDRSLILPTLDVSPASARNALDDALNSGVRLDGIVCRDDLIAMGALRALKERRLAVPDAVAITGWDDTFVASFTNPTLTTVAPDMHALVETALDLLDDRIKGYAGTGRHRIVPHTFVRRESAPFP